MNIADIVKQLKSERESLHQLGPQMNSRESG
jgi:hypothetical protein